MSFEGSQNMKALIPLETSGVHQHTINPKPEFIASRSEIEVDVRNTFPKCIRKDGADELRDAGRFVRRVRQLKKFVQLPRDLRLAGTLRFHGNLQLLFHR
jgi:hypothetical protein